MSSGQAGRITDEQLGRLDYMAKAPERWRESLSNALPALIVELRASRAREQELQQRIDKALAWCREANPRPDLNGDLFRDIIAALTGTEAP